MELMPVRAVLLGVGALGRLVARAAASDRRIDIVAAADNDPAKFGRDLGTLTSVEGLAGIRVAASLAEALRGLLTPPNLVFQMTESRLPRIVPLFEDAMVHGLNVISAAESMFYPNLRYPDVARSLNQSAARHGVTITGMGINPGFVFDRQVLDLAAVSTEIVAIRLNRVVEVRETGPGDIEHVGFGLPLSEFERGVADGHIVGHMGLPESLVLLAERIGLAVDEVAESWEPKTSPIAVASTIGTIPPGHVTGIVQRGVALRSGRPVISTRLAMYFDAASNEPEVDEIEIDGLHSVHLRVSPSSVSILGAAILMVNAAPAVVAAPPGLVNIVDLPFAATPRSDRRYVWDRPRSKGSGHVALVEAMQA